MVTNEEEWTPDGLTPIKQPDPPTEGGSSKNAAFAAGRIRSYWTPDVLDAGLRTIRATTGKSLGTLHREALILLIDRYGEAAEKAASRSGGRKK